MNVPIRFDFHIGSLRQFSKGNNVVRSAGLTSARRINGHLALFRRIFLFMHLGFLLLFREGDADFPEFLVLFRRDEEPTRQPDDVGRLMHVDR